MFPLPSAAVSIPDWLLAAALSVGMLAAAPPLAAAPDAPPAAAKRPVTDEYHGTKVVDDYQWLENPADAEVKAWTAAQNKVTRAYLDALPERAAAEKRLTELYAKVSPSYAALVSRPGGRLFALKFQPPKQQPLLVVLKSADDAGSEKIVLDPNELEPKGKTTIDWFVPSPDGELVAISLSQNGSEDGSLYFYQTDSGERLPDVIPHVQYPTAGGSAAWAGDGKGVFYTRFPRQGERPDADLNFYQQVFFHRLGQPEQKDAYAIGKEFPRIAEIALETSFDGRYVLASVANGDGGEFAHYVLDTRPWPERKAISPDPAASEEKESGWRQLTRFEDGVKEAVLARDPQPYRPSGLDRLSGAMKGRAPGAGGSLFLRSVKDAPHGKILRLPLDGKSGLADARLIVPESADAVIESLASGAAHLYVSDLVGGPSRVRRFDLDGGDPQELPVPPISAVTQLVALQAKGAEDDRLLFRQVSYTSPAAWYSYDSDASVPLKQTALVNTSPVDFSDIEAVREFATSADGTKVPLNILRRKGTKLDGNNPTLLYGYGGYSISLAPNFAFSRRLWFDHGGVYVVANLRGGGEYGEAWHAAGNLTRKQTVFDDFAAAAEYLVKAGYTKPEKLGVEGGSNGGLLMGAFLTQRPDLARAVCAHVGIYDMLRVELDPNGAFNVTEFGTVKDFSQFQALYAYSPYHHVRDGAKYPAVFFMTGDNDGRVNPLHSRKMTARLQAASASGLPILLRTTASAGHGMGTALTEQIAQLADADAFFFDQLGMKPAAAP